MRFWLGLGLGLGLGPGFGLRLGLGLGFGFGFRLGLGLEVLVAGQVEQGDLGGGRLQLGGLGPRVEVGLYSRAVVTSRVVVARRAVS